MTKKDIECRHGSSCDTPTCPYKHSSRRMFYDSHNTGCDMGLNCPGLKQGTKCTYAECLANADRSSFTLTKSGLLLGKMKM